MSKKICKYCQKEKDVKDFNKNNRSRDGLFSKCKVCLSEYREKYIKKIKNRKAKSIFIPKKKECSRCGVVKPSIEFCSHIRNKDGLNYWCKQCVSEYYKNNIDTIKEYDKSLREKFRNRHPSTIIVPKRVKCYCCGKFLSVSKFIKCKAKRMGIDTRCKKCLGKYHVEHALEEKAYRDAHRAEINERARNRRKRVDVRIKEALRSILYSALKRQNIKKNHHTMDLIGCNIDVLKSHIEHKFSHKMTWDNYGKNGWWIDHVIPCVAFDLTKIKEQRKCFNYKNLQPLWWRDNIVKNSYYNNILIRRAK